MTKRQRLLQFGGDRESLEVIAMYLDTIEEQALELGARDRVLLVDAVVELGATISSFGWPR